MRNVLMWLAAVVVLCGVAGAADKLTPSALFTDNVILQREMPVPVFGEAKPGTEVTVSFAGQTVKAKADEKGKWKATLAALKTNKTPATMEISAGEEKITVKDVLVGEVWIASGQSNMDCNMGFFKSNGGKESPEIAKEMEAANFPEIRQFEVTKPSEAERRASSKAPTEVLRGKWVPCSPQTISPYTATGFFFARALYQKLGVPVGLIKNAWGGMPVEAYTSLEGLESTAPGKANIAAMQKRQAEWSKEKADASFKAANEKWEADKAKADAEQKPAPRKPRYDSEPVTTPNYPTTLYNSMVYPLIPYAIRGAIWYQGEANAGNGKGYSETFPAMIKQWRQDWKQGDFPFYFVQLANFMGVTETPQDGGGWAMLREAQRTTLSLPNTGMAVILDVGEEKDIHPRNKVTVGERLALWALAKDYKQNVAAYSGPAYKSVEFKDGKAVLKFDSVGEGLVAGKRPTVWTEPELDSDEPARFQICGADKKWVWGSAKITGKDTVVVSAESVKEPVAVRYCWMNNPGNVELLYNKAGLPASSFRTDDF